MTGKRTGNDGGFMADNHGKGGSGNENGTALKLHTFPQPRREPEFDEDRWLKMGELKTRIASRPMGPEEERAWWAADAAQKAARAEPLKQDKDDTGMRLGAFLFDFIQMAMIDLNLTDEQLQIFASAIERAMHLGREAGRFTPEIAEQAVAEEICLRELIRIRPVSGAPWSN
jgi:hypothetical protein